VIFGSLSLLAQEVKRYVSPDESSVAFVSAVGKLGSESRVRVASKNGKSFCHEEYSSEDGTHGYSVTKAAWTPDSQFFVYSLESSGGHSVMVIPTLFCSVARKKIFDLGDLVDDNVMFPDFSLSAPDQITVNLGTWPHDEKTFSLSTIEKSGKETKPK
jgi:hypothetical protein